MKANVLLHHLVVTGALVLALCLLLLSGTADRAQALPAVGSFVPGEIIIKLTPNAPIAEINDSYDTRVKERFLNQCEHRHLPARNNGRLEHEKQAR